MDTWLLLRNVEFTGERNRTIFVRKSRGMAHSNQVREFVLSDKGIDLVDVYLGGDRVLTGSARVAQEAQERAAAALRGQDHQRKLRQLPADERRSKRRSPRCKPRRRRRPRRCTSPSRRKRCRKRPRSENTDAMAQQRGGAHRRQWPRRRKSDE